MLFQRHRLSPADALAWCRERAPLGWVPRVLVLAYMAYVGVRHVLDGQYSSYFSPINLLIHEVGHIFFSIFNHQWLGIAGGTIAQLAAPLLAGWTFKMQRDYFAIAFALAWLSFSLFNVATYVADARAQQLPLIGLTADPIHDWNFLLNSAGLLPLDQVLAFLIRVLAAALWLGSLALGSWICFNMLPRRTEN